MISVHGNTLYAIAIHKNRSITPFLTLWSHFENRTKNLLSILQLLRTCHMSPSTIQEPKGPEYHEKRNILPHNELRLLSPHHELSVIGYTFDHQVVPLALVTKWTKLLSIALLSSSIGIGLVSSSARVAPIKSQHHTVITHVSE